MAHIFLIYAGPTPWDDEDRLVGNPPLPLTEEARITIGQIVAGLPHPVTSVYRFRKNEACEQAAKIIAARFNLRPRDSVALDEVNLGLWQGLTRSELRFRFPTVFPEWEESPLTVNPPDGELLADAIQRLGSGLKRILRSNRGGSIVLALRPLAMQIILGLLRQEDAQTIAGHLHNVAPVETIEIADNQLRRYVA